MSNPSQRVWLILMRLIVLLILIVMIAGFVNSFFMPIRRFNRLEENARKMITAAELQAWATNLLVQYPAGGYLKAHELGTNFPQQLCGLHPKIGPFIYVHIEDTNRPFVTLRWGSGFLGSTGFEIGATNFVSSSFRKTHAWQPGVYFFRDP